MTELRPVGSEFWHEYPFNPISASARACKRRFLYRVIEHSELLPHGERGPVVKSETVKAIRSQEALVIGMRWDGSYIFGEWEDAP